MDELERMKKGGRRRDPSLPHVFVPQTAAIEVLGGKPRQSGACGECGGSFGLPVHVGVGDSVQAVRERHGPFGE